LQWKSIHDNNNSNVPNVSINNFYKNQTARNELGNAVRKYAPTTMDNLPTNSGIIKDANAPDMSSMPDPVKTLTDSPVIKATAAGGGIVTAGILTAEVAPFVLDGGQSLGTKALNAIKNPINISKTLGDFTAQSFNQLQDNGKISLGEYNITSLVTNLFGAPAPVQGFGSSMFKTTLNLGLKSDFSSKSIIRGSIYTLGNLASGKGTGALKDFRGMTNISTFSTKLGVGTVLNSASNSGANYIDKKINE